MRGLPESAVLSQCLDYLCARSVFAWRNNSGGAKIGKSFVRFGLTGSADILGICGDGRFLAVECKRERGGTLSEAQRSFLERIRRNGGVAVCVRSVSELDDALRKEGVTGERRDDTSDIRSEEDV